MGCKDLWVVILFTLGLSTSPELSWACSCEVPPTPTIGLSRADVVFAGTVVGIEERKMKSGEAVIAIEFSVSQIWKGIVDDKITVFTGLDEAQCGYTFSVGQDYLVYGDTENYVSYELGFPVATICDRTKPLKGAENEVEELSRATVVQPSVWGAIKRFFTWSGIGKSARLSESLRGSPCKAPG